MAKITLYRRPDTGAMCLRVTNGPGDSARHTLPVKLEAKEWDGEHVTSAHPRRAELNAYLSGILSKAILELMKIQEKMPTKNMSAVELKDLVIAVVFQTEGEDEKKHVLFEEIYKEFADTHSNARTRELYMITLKRIREYDQSELTFEDITRRWLECFDQHLALRSPSVNARAIHYRNIKAVFNYALDDGLTEWYPFRRKGFKIQTEETIHRDLEVDEIRKLFDYQPPTERNNKHHTKPLDYAVKYVDIAKLIFFTIGINPVDLFEAIPEEYHGGRIVYRRAKTHKGYNIKVEPEAAAIIEKYRGTKMLLSMCENRESYKSLAKSTNIALKKISKQMGLPPVTMYWMRHSWASIAYEIGASFDMVSDCLGHSHGSKDTATYVNKKRKRIFRSKDELNRAVIDYVLYGIE